MWFQCRNEMHLADSGVCETDIDPVPKQRVPTVSAPVIVQSYLPPKMILQNRDQQHAE
jgi:hypothetical protein